MEVHIGKTLSEKNGESAVDGLERVHVLQLPGMAAMVTAPTTPTLARPSTRPPSRPVSSHS